MHKSCNNQLRFRPCYKLFPKCLTVYRLCHMYSFWTFNTNLSKMTFFLLYKIKCPSIVLCLTFLTFPELLRSTLNFIALRLSYVKSEVYFLPTFLPTFYHTILRQDTSIFLASHLVPPYIFPL